jgi:pimeloyl-ACP methyl ester carboxylesterase
MEIAVLRPERFSKMLLVNAAGIRVAESPMGELFIDDLDQLRRLLFHNAEGDHVEEAMPTSLNDSRILMWLRAREATARVGWNPYLHDPKLPDHLHRVSCPALVLWGRRDQLIPLPHGERLAELLPNAELRILDDCGHMLPYEKRVEFVEICRDFLSR